ncbi:MAG: alpha/beta hydrolase [Terriglobales bacterium]
MAAHRTGTVSTSATIRSMFLQGPAGRLEALLNEGAPGATHAAVVCHPHPLFGGTMHNKVVFQAMKALNSFGFPVLRFNFRGTGLSEGNHDQGRGEVDDVRVALNWLDTEFHLPIIFAGFSFGAAAGLRAGCPDPRVQAVISLGTPIQVDDRSYGYGFLNDCHKPKLFISGSNDQFGPRRQLEQLISRVAPAELVIVEGGDHFFAGHLAEMRNAMENWMKRLLGS